MTPDWVESLKAVPRALFLPTLMWAHDMTTGESVPVSRTDDPDEWQRQAFTDVPIVTQWDDGEHEGTEPGSLSTSSASMPSVVTSMLRDLDVKPGLRVLEIGTGTGWNCALLAHRLGSENVVSVEVDGAVAAQARTNLSRAGLHPDVIRGNGELGWQRDAPYNRIIATAGVRSVPPAWLAQTRPGGVILAPWGTHYGNEDALVRLTVNEDGSASGPFLRPVAFMKLRDQRLDWERFSDYVSAFPGDAIRSTTRLTPNDLGSQYETARFVTGLVVPDLAHVVNQPDADTTNAWFFDLTSRSWAAVVFRTGEPFATAYQSGGRQLWDEVEQALTWWAREGRPELDQFGLTVLPDGEQRPWLGDPMNTIRTG
ncbi:methyltransferase domain-containing protein [Streptacidiphilus cavernicola]|uniref:Protein-L-isoaspartate O-methyltransferase n=1 Tax=Streptacidiphilus cavernicola TaxID=3342716 RepID=A0ABV6W2Z8_9ACTN